MMILTIGGALGRDPETKRLPDGKTVTNMNVAVNGYDYKAREKVTTWVRVSMFGDRGEKLGQAVHKGDRIMASGEPRFSIYNDKVQIELTAQSFSIISSKPRDEEPPARQQSKPATKPKQAAEFPDDEDVPF